MVLEIQLKSTGHLKNLIFCSLTVLFKQTYLSSVSGNLFRLNKGA
jgi:hypothetical protein